MIVSPSTRTFDAPLNWSEIEAVAPVWGRIVTGADFAPLAVNSP